MIRLSRSSLGLLLTLAATGLATTLVHCGTTDSAADDESDVGEAVGINNRLGLKLVYLDGDKKVYATLPRDLPADYKLYVNVRRGKITNTSHDDMRCHEVAPRAVELRPTHLPDGTSAYEGPSVPDELVKLLDLFNDERWATGGETPEMNADVDAGPDPIVEACIVKGDPATGHVLAKLVTNLAYAWDRGTDVAEAVDAPIADVAALAEGVHGNRPNRARGLTLSGLSRGVTMQAGRRRDAAVDTGRDGTLREGRQYNMIDYAKLCMQELGDIPFFKPIKDARGNPTGKYETFDCRDFTGSNTGGQAAAIAGVEGTVIPMSVNDVAQDTCSRATDRSVRSYDCVDKCDRGMYLTASAQTSLGEKASCQPGVTVTTAKNAKGTHWVLLCRKVENTGPGMLKTKKFNDIAMIGSNPATGRTCFFQNEENVGNDGAHVTHPADAVQSNHIWPSDPPSYCTGSCHVADAFIHSPWIDEAKHKGAGAVTIVPKMGELPDFPISDNSRPYSLINGPSQGFGFDKQLVGEGVEQCTTCHRVAGKAFTEFADWATGTGEAYYGKITPKYKEFAKSHWMPQRLDGLTAETFDGSAWGKAVKHIRKCLNPSSGATSDFPCEFADIPSKR